MYLLSTKRYSSLQIEQMSIIYRILKHLPCKDYLVGQCRRRGNCKFEHSFLKCRHPCPGPEACLMLHLPDPTIGLINLRQPDLLGEDAIVELRRLALAIYKSYGPEIRDQVCTKETTMTAICINNACTMCKSPNTWAASDSNSF